jgi:hypothetical protein
MADRRLAVYHSGCNFSYHQSFLPLHTELIPASPQRIAPKQASDMPMRTRTQLIRSNLKHARAAWGHIPSLILQALDEPTRKYRLSPTLGDVAKGFISVALHAFPSSFSPPCQCGFSSDFPAPFRSKSFTPSLSAELAQMNCVGISFLLFAHACPERYVEGVFKIKTRFVDIAYC